MSGETNEILQRLARVETKLDMMLEDRDIADAARKTADEALQSARAAHDRLNTHAKIIFWAATTIIGAVILAVIGYVMKGDG